MSSIEMTKSETLSTVLCGMGVGVLVAGVFLHIANNGAIAGLGTMSMNSYYLLSSALSLAAIAVKVVFK